MSLSVLLDENVAPEIADYLRTKRPAWTVWQVREVGLRGSPDLRIFDWAQQRRAVVVTFDEDFADTRMYPLGSHAGIIRLRVWPTTVEETKVALDRLLGSIEDEVLPGSLISSTRRESGSDVPPSTDDLFSPRVSPIFRPQLGDPDRPRQQWRLAAGGPYGLPVAVLGKWLSAGELTLAPSPARGDSGKCVLNLLYYQQCQPDFLRNSLWISPY